MGNTNPFLYIFNIIDLALISNSESFKSFLKNSNIVNINTIIYLISTF